MSGLLTPLALHLAQRRQEILLAWRTAVSRDAELTNASLISRTQFYDHIPQVLDAFEHRLRAADATSRDEARAEQKQTAAEHGLHRWQQGYNQYQTMREWTHLNLCLLDEIERFALSGSPVDPTIPPIARRALAQLCGEGVCESAARYASMQQIEAASRLRDLEQALAQLQLVDRERAERWREAAHDLRGTVNVVTTAAAVLDRDGVPESARTHLTNVVRRGASSLHDLLADLMDLARLEAGQERRKVVPFDAAKMLHEFCVPLRALVTQRNLFFHTQGVDRLPVEGDPVKVQRIVQNLVLNALKATSRGGIRVTWEELTIDQRSQWVVCVQDTGPGLDPRKIAPLEHALQHATEESKQIEEQSHADASGTALEPAPTLPSRSSSELSPEIGGEGIGLSIIKRLCELLDASLELETSAGEGTTFRVIFPRQYQPVR